MKTFSAKSEEVQRDWYVVDASNQTLGRLASDIAHRLRGKHKAEYTPHVDTGDYIVVVNAADIHVTGKKMKDKLYRHHTGYPGGLKSIALEDLLEKAPERVLETAIKGMLPKNPLGRQMFRKLKVYPGADHPHTAQQPATLDFNAARAGIAHVSPSKFVAEPKVREASKPTVAKVAKKAPAKEKTSPDAPGLQTASTEKISFGGKKFKFDDLKIVEGIGPKIEELLHNAGILSWNDLAGAEVDKVKAVLSDAGSRYQMHDPSSWPKQAGMCVAQQWDELQAYQDALDGGKEVS